MLQKPWVEVLGGFNGLTHAALQHQPLDLCGKQEYGSEKAADAAHSHMP